MISRLIIISAGLFFIWSGIVSADDIRNQRDDLKEIQAEVAKRKKRLDSLKQVELQAQKRIGNFDQKISSNKKQILVEIFIG